jgi:hypothetical protein
MQVKCSQCKQPVEVHNMPQPQIFNTPGASVVLLEHPKQAFCLNCKATVTVVLAGAQLMLQAIPVAPPHQQPIVLVPGMPKNGKQ